MLRYRADVRTLSFVAIYFALVAAQWVWPPSSFGLAILAQDYLLDLELTALETEGRGQVVSSPRVITANQREAVIKQGDEVGYVTISPQQGGNNQQPGGKGIERAGVSNTSRTRRAAHRADDIVRGDSCRLVDEQQPAYAVAHAMLTLRSPTPAHAEPGPAIARCAKRAQCFRRP